MTRLNRMGLAACLSLLMAAFPFGTSDAGKPDVSMSHPNFVRVPAVTRATEATGVISARSGGEITVGRISVRFPGGALREDATVRVRVPDPTQLHVELEISPKRANRFHKPVTLTADFRDGLITNPESLRWIWLDEGNGKWEPVRGNALELRGGLIRVPLWHFSVYGVVEGKAGW